MDLSSVPQGPTQGPRLQQLEQQSSGVDDTVPETHPLLPSQKSSADACTESLTPPTTWRLLLAAIGAPVDFFVSNAEPELQTELASASAVLLTKSSVKDNTERSTSWRISGAWMDVMTTMVSLRDTRALKEGSTATARRSHAEKELVLALLDLQATLLVEKRLLSSIRGEAGETILHIAALFKLYDVALLLLDMEPMLMAGCYLGSKYKDENIVHMLCAGGELLQLRRVAQRALYPRDEVVDVGPVGTSVGPPLTTVSELAKRHKIAFHREHAWRLLWAWESATAARNGEDPRSRGPLTADWCRAWLRATWMTLINGVCTGSFFRPPPEGTCYYGGTPLSFAAVLGHVDVVRFLVVEVGCTQPELWTEVAAHESGQAAKGTLAMQVAHQDRRVLSESRATASSDFVSTHAPHIDRVGRASRDVPMLRAQASINAMSVEQTASTAATLAFAALEARAAEERLTLFPGSLGSMELMRQWDPSLCARIDVQDNVGNTAGHLAVMHFSSAHMFEFLASLYHKGYGRCDTAALYSEPHAQLARAVLALRCMRLRQDEVLFFSPEPAHPNSAFGTTTRGPLTGSGSSGSIAAIDDTGVPPLAPKPYASRRTGEMPMRGAGVTAGPTAAWTSPVAAPPPLPPSPPLASESTSISSVELKNASNHSARSTMTTTSTSGNSPRKRAPTFRSVSCYVGVYLASSIYSLHRVVPTRPGVFCTSSCGTAFLKEKQSPPMTLGDAAAAARQLARSNEASASALVESLLASVAVLIAEASIRRPARASVGSHSLPSFPIAWRELEVTVRQKIDVLELPPGCTEEYATEARRAAAGLAYIQGFASDLKRSVAARPQLIALLNNDGLTPLTLAAQRGKRAIVESLWRKSSSLAWKWGSVTARTFELAQIDDIGQIADAHPGIVASLSVDPDASVKSQKTQDEMTSSKQVEVRPTACCGSLRCSTATLAMLRQCCGVHRGRNMRSAAWCCGPRHVFRLPTSSGTGVRNALSAIWKSAFLPLRFLSSLPPVPESQSLRMSAGFANSCHRTVLQEVIRGGHWHMLEPSEGEMPEKAMSEVVSGAALSASICVQGVVNHAITAGHALHDHRETAVDLYNRYRARATEIASHDIEENDQFAADDTDGISGNPYGGKKHNHEDSGRQLLQLVQRKWMRLYSVYFFRAALLRTLTVMFVWGVVILRAGLASSSGPDDISCKTSFPGGTIGSCRTVQALVYILAVGSASTFVWHFSRLLVLGQTGRRLLSALGACCSRSPRWQLQSNAHTSAAYIAGHSGSFGRFYVVSLLAASSLLGVAGFIDLRSGWQASSVLYAIGGFFAGGHLLYFLLGFARTGPLMVMLGVALPTFSRWLCLFVPTILVFAFALFVLSQPADGTANGFSQFFNVYVLGAFDNSMQPQTTADFVTLKSTSSVAGQLFFVLFAIALILVSNIALLAILIAIMTHAFQAHLAAPRSRWHIERARIIMQLESTMSAWDRLSVPFNNRYFLWAARAAPSAAATLLSLPPPALLGEHFYPASEAVASGNAAAPHISIDVGAQLPTRRPMFYCQEEGSASSAPRQGRRAKEMLQSRLAASNRATLRLRDVQQSLEQQQRGPPDAHPSFITHESNSVNNW